MILQMIGGGGGGSLDDVSVAIVDLSVITELVIRYGILNAYTRSITA